MFKKIYITIFIAEVFIVNQINKTKLNYNYEL